MAREKRGGGPQRYFPHLKGTHFMRNIDQKNKKLRVLTAALAAAVLALLLPGAVLAQDAAAAHGMPPDCAAVSSDVGEISLYPGGMPFGVKFYTDGVLIVGFSGGAGSPSGPAYAAGLRVNDTIMKIDGKPLSDASDLTDAIKQSGGRTLKLDCRRGGSDFTVELTPKRGRDGQFQTGMWVRDSGAGIGTVTFIVPSTGGFGGLGHGICDADTGKPVPLGRGSVVGVTISGLTKGLPGTPGEIKGYFTPGKEGTVIQNSDLGVFGLYRDTPTGNYSNPIPAAGKNELKEGAATMLCTLDSGEIGEYAIEIHSIDRSAVGGRCFSIRVTDPALLERTGGIIQGMSGSPIIQNGKLVGAVTHVLINDPSAGYGVFIENIYNAMPEILR